jgi:phosphate:Na+ symporter
VTEADMTDSIKYENRINELRNMLKRKNIEDVNDNLYDYQTGVFYMDLIVECEHMGDYILNVVQSIQHQKY